MKWKLDRRGMCKLTVPHCVHSYLTWSLDTSEISFVYTMVDGKGQSQFSWSPWYVIKGPRLVPSIPYFNSLFQFLIPFLSFLIVSHCLLWKLAQRENGNSILLSSHNPLFGEVLLRNLDLQVHCCREWKGISPQRKCLFFQQSSLTFLPQLRPRNDQCPK